MLPTPAAQVLIDQLAAGDHAGALACLTTLPLADQDQAVCHALEQGWDTMAALVLRANPDVIQDERTTPVWQLRSHQRLLWVLAWAKGNRQSAEALLASGKAWASGWDSLGLSLKAGWDDLLEPMAVQLNELQKLESRGLAEAIRLGNRAAFDRLRPYLPITTQHVLAALTHGQIAWADELWSGFAPHEIEAHVAEGVQEKDGRPKANPVWPIHTLDGVVVRLTPNRQAVWQAWATEHGLDLPQLRAHQRTQVLETVSSNPGRSRPRS